MQLDIARTPFSKYGSNVSVGDEPEHGQLVIRNIRKKWGLERLFGLTFTQNGEPVSYTLDVSPWLITAHTTAGTARIWLRGDAELLIESTGPDVCIKLLDGQHGFGYPVTDDRYQIISIFGRLYISLDVLAGTAQPQFIREVKNGHQHSAKTEFTLGCPLGGRALLRMELTPTETVPAPVTVDPDREIAEVKEAWQAFLAKMPPVPEGRMDSATLAWYTIWSCFVRKEGNFAYDALLMSKGGMASVWSWDHCFNALALAKVDVKAAIEQWLLPFELQGPNGELPDFWSVDEFIWMVVKPPVHGWAIQRILSDHMLEPELLRKIYGHLSRWTEWWMALRDTDNDGVPNYLQGVDSGWDNATLFDLGIGLESPDLSAFLVLQMQALAMIAGLLHDDAAARDWAERAKELLRRLNSHLWNGDGYVAKISRTHEFDPQPTCLLTVMPLVLGGMLDREKFDRLVARLEKDFLTPYGLATEAPSSAKYLPNGYWRGPIWAPSTYLLVDGLRRGGRTELAAEIARRFCDTIQTAGGNYENYNALTGAGLCDQGYTWTAAVNLLLMTEYLSPLAAGV